MPSRSSADTPLLLAGLGLLVAAAALPFTVLHLSTSSHDLGGARPAALLAAPCPQYPRATSARAGSLPPSRAAPAS